MTEDNRTETDHGDAASGATEQVKKPLQRKVPFRRKLDHWFQSSGVLLSLSLAALGLATFFVHVLTHADGAMEWLVADTEVEIANSEGQSFILASKPAFWLAWVQDAVFFALVALLTFFVTTFRRPEKDALDKRIGYLMNSDAVHRDSVRSTFNKEITKSGAFCSNVRLTFEFSPSREQPEAYRVKAHCVMQVENCYKDDEYIDEEFEVFVESILIGEDGDVLGEITEIRTTSQDGEIFEYPNLPMQIEKRATNDPVAEVMREFKIAANGFKTFEYRFWLLIRPQEYLYHIFKLNAKDVVIQVLNKGPETLQFCDVSERSKERHRSKSIPSTVKKEKVFYNNVIFSQRDRLKLRFDGPIQSAASMPPRGSGQKKKKGSP